MLRDGGIGAANAGPREPCVVLVWGVGFFCGLVQELALLHVLSTGFWASSLATSGMHESCTHGMVLGCTITFFDYMI